MASALKQPEPFSLIAAQFWSSVLAGVGILLLYTPVFITSGVAAVTSNRFVTPQTWPVFLQKGLAEAAATWRFWHRDMPGLVMWVLLLGVLVTILFYQRAASQSSFPLPFAIVLTLVPLLVIQRVVGFARVWLFLLPLYFGFAGMGLTLLARQAARWVDRPNHMTRYAQPVALTLIITYVAFQGVRIAQSPAIYLSQADGTLRAAEDIARYLKANRQPTDAVLTELPSGPPLAYYAAKHGLDIATYPTADTETLYIVVNDANPTLASPRAILLEREITLSDYGHIELVAVFEDARLYAVRAVDD